MKCLVLDKRATILAWIWEAVAVRELRLMAAAAAAAAAAAEV